jgi:serine/threonine protein kinase
VHTAGDTNGLPYYTMPYVEGESLRTRLDRGPLDVAEVIDIVRDVTRALAYAHQRGVVHRDIKPDNVLMSGGAAVVTDFGIAKAISASRTASGDGLTQTGTSIGTPAYMAPEQIAGDPGIDHRADVYSLGAMVYELLAGHVVFPGRTPQRMLAAHVTEVPTPIGDVRAGVPRIENLCRCETTGQRRDIVPVRLSQHVAAEHGAGPPQAIDHQSLRLLRTRESLATRRWAERQVAGLLDPGDVIDAEIAGKRNAGPAPGEAMRPLVRLSVLAVHGRRLRQARSLARRDRASLSMRPAQNVAKLGAEAYADGRWFR